MSGPTDLDRDALAQFDALAELPADVREARLQALAAAAPLLARRLRALFTADAADGGVVDAGLPALASTLGERLAETPGFQAGARVGGFRCLHPLGRGGMGEVWLAERAEGDFRQQVALKRLRGGLGGADIERRFALERRILAELSHPGIARFVDGGVDGDGRPWFAMEYVEGVPVTEYARSRSLGLRDRVALLAAVADAVSYAQNRLVVHRDLKPSNILIDGDGRPRLLDFGIAKLLGEAPDQGETLTGVRAMSPGYAAPEQVLGEPVTMATDVYALGVVLYELLTGRLPHARAGVALELLAEQVRSEQAEPPSLRLRDAATPQLLGLARSSPQRLAREVAGDLDTILLAALRREPDRRYASAAALAEDLRRWLDGRPVAARPDTRSYRIRKFVSRNRWAVGSASGMLLALIAGLGVALWQADVARQAQARAEAEAVRAEAVKRFFSAMFQRSDPNLQRAGAELTARQWVEDAAARIDGDLADAPEAQAEIRVALGSALSGFGASEAALPLLERGVADLRLHGQSPGTLVVALQLLAQERRQSGDLQGAGTAIEEAIARNETVTGFPGQAERRLQLKTTLLTLANARADHARAVVLGRELLAARIAAHGADSPRLAVDWNNLGQSLQAQERMAESEPALAEALRLLRLDEQAPQTRHALVLPGLARAQAAAGRFDEALGNAGEARAIAMRAFGAQHPQAQRIAAIELGILVLAGRSDEAARLLGAIHAEGPVADEAARLLLDLHASHLSLGGAVDVALIDRADAWLPRRDLFPLSVLELDAVAAVVQARSGRLDAARVRASASRERLSRWNEVDSPRLAGLRLLLAEALSLAGEAEAAAGLAAEGRAMWRRCWGADMAPPPLPWQVAWALAD